MRDGPIDKGNKGRRRYLDPVIPAIKPASIAPGLPQDEEACVKPSIIDHRPRAVISFAEIEAACRTGRAAGCNVFDTTCPACSTGRKAGHQRLPVLRVWCDADDYVTFHCVHCEIKGFAFRDGIRRELAPAERAKIERRRREAEARHCEAVAESHRKAAWLWQSSVPLPGTVAETYLRQARGIRCALPPALRLLPARGDHPPAMIAAFHRIQAVHLTKLAADGSGKAGTDKDKIFVGKEVAAPLWLAPITDGLGLVITEGIEDALSLHQVTGLGAWAAGSASRLPALADQVPNWIEVVSIVEDADDSGRRNAAELAERLIARGIEVRQVAS